MKTEEEILKLFEAQNELNRMTISDNWLETKKDWTVPIMVESAELIESLDWKWWKKGEDNIENAKMELIDILFFSLSHFYKVRYSYVEAPTSYGIKQFDRKAIIYSIKLLSRYVLNPHSLEYIDNVFDEIFLTGSLLGMSEDEIFKLYYAKHTLNVFRLKNGYKDGTYQKIIDGKEDNAHLMEMMTHMEFDSDFKDKLYEKFKDFYFSHID